jgi:hypothetical protein
LVEILKSTAQREAKSISRARFKQFNKIMTYLSKTKIQIKSKANKFINVFTYSLTEQLFSLPSVQGDSNFGTAFCEGRLMLQPLYTGLTAPIHDNDNHFLLLLDFGLYQHCTHNAFIALVEICCLYTKSTIQFGGLQHVPCEKIVCFAPHEK